MPFRWQPREHLAVLLYVLKWGLVAIPVSAVIGSACALFLWTLDWATQAQWSHPGLLYLLPVAGVAIALTYRAIGGNTEAGNNLIMDEIHSPGAGVPARMAPLILLATVFTHLFGGSAGREGTAVQMGGSLAATIARALHLNRIDGRKLLMVGVAAGFGGVFGTPLAGCLFAMEVIAIGRVSYEAIVPCLIGGIVGDRACAMWGISHTQYHIDLAPVGFDALTAGKVALAAIAFGLASVIFAELTHGLHTLWKRAAMRLEKHRRWGRLAIEDFIRPITGAMILIGLTLLLGTRDYLGLGVLHSPGGHVSITDAFHSGGADAFSWGWKILFTAITLSSGFKGGEVTPLFFVGAALGHTLAQLLHAPIDLFAGLGLVAVFAGATNTPLACTLMGIELFGSDHTLYLAMACFLAYLFSGHSGIYLSQRVGTPKVLHLSRHSERTLAQIRSGESPKHSP